MPQSPSLVLGAWRRVAAVHVAAVAAVAAAFARRRAVTLSTLAVTTALAACDHRFAADDAATLGPNAQSVVPLVVAAGADLMESSAAAVSAVHEGIVYTLNDSGHDAVVFAFDTTGGDRGRWRLASGTNRDWEAAAVGPCGGVQSPTSCVVVGDVGDNGLNRREVVLYRFPEPALLPALGQGRVVAESLRVRFDDHAHNVEAMYVAGDGAILLLTKEAMRSADGATRPTLAYRIDASAWGRATHATAALIDSFPIIPGSGTRRAVTDAALASDGTLLAIRTYAQVYFFAVDSVTGRPRAGALPVTCNVTPLREPQGEGVGVLGVGAAGTSARLILTSEGGSSVAHLASCPLGER